MINWQLVTPTYDPAIIERFARAVAKPGAPVRYIDRDNKLAGYDDNIGEAARSGLPFFVLPTDDLLALDADSFETGGLIDGAPYDMERDGVYPVVVASGQPGRRHLFARIDGPTTKARWEDWARRQGIDVRKGGAGIRPPLSPHRLGLSVRLAYPATVEDALVRLERPRRESHTLQQATIPRPTAQLLKFGMDAPGAEEKYRSDQSRLVGAIVQGLANAGFSCAEILSLLRDLANPGGQKVQKMSEQVAAGYVGRCYNRAVARMRSPIRNSTEALRRIDEIERAVSIAPFPGRGGENERAVVRAHVAIARRCKGVEHRASDRQIAEEARIERRTVSDIHKRLVCARDGWLHRWRSARWERKATEWTLCLPTGRNLTAHLSSRPPDIHGRIGSDSDDVWRSGGGLGKTAGRTWDQLEGLTTAELAAKRRVGPRAALKQLDKLREHGLAFSDAAGLWHQIDRRDEVARKLGVAGKRAAQEQQHDEERNAFDLTRRMRSAAIVDHTTGEVLNPPKPDFPDYPDETDEAIYAAELGETPERESQAVMQ